MASIRAVGIVLDSSRVLLMYRRRAGKEYYVFPGGGVEPNETVEAAVIRELKEETSLTVRIERLLYHHHYIGDSDQYFYLCTHVSGTLMLGDSNEKEAMLNDPDDYYEPMWVPLADLSRLTVYPLEIRDWLIEDVNTNFRNTPREASLHVSELRQ